MEPLNLVADQLTIKTSLTEDLYDRLIRLGVDLDDRGSEAVSVALGDAISRSARLAMHATAAHCEGLAAESGIAAIFAVNTTDEESDFDPWAEWERRYGDDV